MGDREEALRRVRDALPRWQQGDCVLGGEVVLRSCPTRSPAKDREPHGDAGADGRYLAVSVKGFVVVSQTCDVIRDPADRPWVEVAALTEVSPEVLRQVRRARRPRYVFVPALEERRLVGDLDLVMTVEKNCLCEWERVRGCVTTREARRFAWSVARKRGRPAFPDDFVETVRDLLGRIREKSGRNSPEGRAIDALREIRVTASPSWHSEEISLFFHFILEEDDPAQLAGGEKHVEAWLDRVKPAGRYVKREGILCTLEDVTAREYVNSEPLDLEYLSLE